MPGPAIQWKTYENETWVASVATRGRYKIAVPRKVTGTPTLTMAAAGQTATIKIYPEDCGKPGGEITLSGTTATPLVDATGNVISGQDLVDMSLEVVSLSSGASILTTDEPNGSPSAPFPDAAARNAWAAANLASLLPGRTTAWGPGSVEYVWNGPLATDWQGIRGPYLGSPSNPFATFAELNSVLPPASNKGTAYMNRLAGSGAIEMFSDGVAWAPKSCLPIVDLLDVHASVTPGNTDPNDVTLFTVPGGMWRSLDSWRFQLTYETAANTGGDGFSIRVNGVDLIATYAAPNALIAVIAGYRRITTTLRRNYTIVGSGVSVTNPGATNVDFANDVVFVSRLTPANGANTITLRRFSMWRE